MASSFAHDVEGSLRELLGTRSAALAAVDPRCEAIGTRLVDFVLGGGKRMRPGFALAAYEGCAGTRAEGPLVARDQAVRAASALELIQACALVHDDIIDSSATRRGVPTVHVALAAEHRAQGWAGEPEAYGRSQAILLGDIALAWADDVFTGALLSSPGIGIDTLSRAHDAWAAMRTEVLGGQMLDVHAEATGAADLETPAKVNRFKTAAYTIERPVHLGAVLAGADDATIAALRDFGVSIGLAFQLVDDLLGVFGDPEVTGKPSGDDLREGKRTVLINSALSAGGPAAEELASMLGTELSAERLARARAILEDAGAVEHVRADVDALTEKGLRALDAAELSPSGREALRALALRAVSRTS